MRYTNKHRIPGPLVKALMNDEYVKRGDISATGLNMPPLMRRLYEIHDSEIVTDVSEEVWALLGTSVHAIIAAAGKGNWLSEEALMREVAGWKISGRPDLLEQETVKNGDGAMASRLVLTDYKVTSTWAVKFGLKQEWESQVNTYAWLWQGVGFDPTRLQVVCILRDWLRSKAEYDREYPSCQIATMLVPKWTRVKFEQWIRARVQLHQVAEELAPERLTICTAQERWRRPTTYAVKKKGTKKARRVLDTMEQALAWIEDKGGADKGKLLVEVREGHETRCADGWCKVARWCPYGKEFVGQKRVVGEVAGVAV